MVDINKLGEILERIANSLEVIAEYCRSKMEMKGANIREGNIMNNEVEFPSSELKVANDISKIEEFLHSRGIRIKSLRKEDNEDEVLDRIAFFMGERYSYIKEFYLYLKRFLNTGKAFSLHLKGYKQKEIASITQLCTLLHDIAFLEEYRYLKSPKYHLYAKVNKIPIAINFFTGGWLERYVKTAVIKAINTSGLNLNYSYLKNPQIILPNEDDFELDILFRIKEHFFWFEAKTGDYQKYVEKYSKIARILRLDREHAYMILTDITETVSDKLDRIFKMRVVPIGKFYDSFRESLRFLLS